MDNLIESLNEATEAALKALLALILMLAILVARTFQAIFFLARPTALLGCVVAAGYTSVVLFGTVLVRYGGDLPAVLLALSAVVIVPAALLVLAGDYGVWAVMMAVAVIEFLVHLGIERAPPIVIAALPAVGLIAATLYHMKQPYPEQQGQATKGENKNEQIGNGSTGLDNDHCSGNILSHL